MFIPHCWLETFIPLDCYSQAGQDPTIWLLPFGIALVPDSYRSTLVPTPFVGLQWPHYLPTFFTFDR